MTSETKFRSVICGIDADDALWCWEDNSTGQLGIGTTELHHKPEQVTAESGWASISTGLDYSCGVTTGGKLYCWGDHTDAKTGVGETAGHAESPTEVVHDTDWTSVSTGYRHSCAIDTDGELYCWGANADDFGVTGQLGIGSFSQGPYDSPQAVSGSWQWGDVAAGEDHTCAVNDDNELFCWGYNGFGQLGLGFVDWDYPSSYRTPQFVSDGPSWQSVVSGRFYSCSFDTDSNLYCWGHNRGYKLGLGDSTDRDVPTQVPFPAE